MMSNLQAAINVADQLITRLFDQQQFTSGEINYLHKELDTSNTNLSNANDEIAKDICQKVSSLKEKTEKLLLIEEDRRRKEEVLLAEVRGERAKVKQEHERDIKNRLENLTETLAKEELELEKKYLKFEENALRSK